MKTEEQKIAHAAYMREWCKRNPEKKKANDAATHLKHREARLAKQHEYFARVRDEVNAKRREDRKNGKIFPRTPLTEEQRKARKAYHKEWTARNADRVRLLSIASRARRSSAIGSLSQKDWHYIVEKQGEKCFDCGEKAELTVGHLVPICRGGSNFPMNIVAQCMPCNTKQGRKVHPKASISLFDMPPRATARTVLRNDKNGAYISRENGEQKLTWEIVRWIRLRWAKGQSQQSIAREFKLGTSSVHRIVHNVSWIESSEDYDYAGDVISRARMKARNAAPQPKLSPQNVLDIRAHLEHDKSIGVGRRLARKYGVMEKTITNIKHRHTWREVGEELCTVTH